MEISARGIDLIKQFEGLSLMAYRCPAGKLTIGYGHVIGAGEDFSPAGITENAAQSLLAVDVQKLILSIAPAFTITPSQNQADAMLSLAYNIGAGAFRNSMLLKLFNQGKSQEAARQFSRWIHIGSDISQGLISRRGAEKALFLS